MQYRRFGKTELNMPVFSCGGMRYQHQWQDVPLDQVPQANQENLRQTIAAALAAGIHHIETARGYGSSERQLGQILPDYPRQALIVQTKIGPTENPDDFTRDFEDSLARLRLNRVDLLAIHGINDEQTLHMACRPGGCLAAARKIQERGLAGHIGFSTHGACEVITQAINCPNDGGFDYVNLHWYYIYQSNWPAVQAAIARDMGVFIISPSDKGGMLYDPPDALVELCEPLHPLVFNDLFCLSHPQVHTLSIGASRPTDFARHLETLELLDKADTLLPPILNRLAECWDQRIEPELRKPFELGLPRWQDTPGNMNLPIILWLRNLVKAYDMKKYAQMRYNLLGNGGHWFPGQNAAKAAEADLSALPLGKQLQKYLAEAHDMMATAPVQRLSESGK